MYKFIHSLPRYSRRPFVRTYRNYVRTYRNYKSRFIQCLKGKALPRALAAFGTGVALWMATTTIVGAEETIYRYGLRDNKDHLRKMEDDFRQHASLNINGELLMTEEDFINAVTEGDATPEKKAQISSCFQLADINKDHHISFLEYALFMHLNAAPDAFLQMSFRLFDINGDGYISLEEFQNVVSLHTPNKIDVHERSTKEFGVDGKKQLNYSEFVRLLGNINHDILKQQFKENELPDRPGYINPDQGVNLLRSRAPPSSPVYLIETFNKMIKDEEPIHLSQYLAFVEVMKHLDNIEHAIELYTITGGSVDKKDFSRAMHISTGKDLSESEVDVIFSMFDQNNKGVLDHNSLDYIRKKRDKRWIYEPDSRTIMPKINFLLLGAVSAKISTIIVYPLDKIKTRQQLTPIQLHPLTTSTRRIFLKEGIKGYLRGVGSMLAVVTPEKAVKLFVSNYVRLYLERQDGIISDKVLNIEAIAGFATGVAQALIVNPFEIVKVKLQMLEHRSKDGTWRCLYNLGIRNFYRGLSVTLIRDILFNMTYLSMFSWGKKKFQDENRLGGFRLFVAHAAASAVAVVVSAPAETVRSHFHYSSLQNTSPLKCYRSIVSQEGLHGLFKGTVPRTLVVVTLFALTFTIFDFLQRNFEPDKILGLSTWQRDLDLVRADRQFCHNLDKMKNDLGLDLDKTKNVTKNV